MNPEICAFLSRNVKIHDVLFQFIQRLLEVYYNLNTLHDNKGNNKITELQTILQRESPNS